MGFSLKKKTGRLSREILFILAFSGQDSVFACKATPILAASIEHLCGVWFLPSFLSRPATRPGRSPRRGPCGGRPPPCGSRSRGAGGGGRGGRPAPGGTRCRAPGRGG